jgi:FtsP/CotA-like multicopper oxidase with cupredoxin domain
MKMQPTLLAIALALTTQALAAGSDIPDEIKPPAGEKVILKAQAQGSQIYVCQAGADGKPQWTLKAPEAELHDKKGAVIGSHYAGPTWKLKDGSEVTGKAAAKVNSPDAASIPWLLLTVVSHAGGDGKLSGVTHIQRVHTRGGQPPAASACDSSKLNTEAKSAYSADYYFLAPPN